jgi:hypothetical protein
MSNDQWSLQVGGAAENPFLNRSGYLDKFGLWAHFQKESGRTPNTKILENFITFITRGRTLNFDLE